MYGKFGQPVKLGQYDGLLRVMGFVKFVGLVSLVSLVWFANNIQTLNAIFSLH